MLDGAEGQGVDPARISGTIQNDLLKEYVARGTYIYPPRPSMRLITDIFAYCKEHTPRWNTISISGYHIREAGSTAVQEIAFTLSNGIAYVQAAVDAGLDVDEFAPRLSFFWNGHNNFFEEVAKFRAARRLWAFLMRDRRKAGKTRHAVIDQCLAQSGTIDRHQQHALGRTAGARFQESQQVCRGHRRGIDTGDAHACGRQWGQPFIEPFGIGEAEELNALIAPPVRLAAEREGLVVLDAALLPG